MKDDCESEYGARFWFPEPWPEYLNVWMFKTNHLQGTQPYSSVQPNPSGVTLRLVVTGSWKVLMRGRTFSAEPGDIFCAWPGERICFSHTDPETPWEWLELQFNGPAAGNFPAQFGLTPDSPCASPSDAVQTKLLFQKLHSYMNDPGRVPAALLSMLFELIAAVGKAPPDKRDTVRPTPETMVAKALDYLETAPCLEYNVSELAAYLNVDRGTLCRAFRKVNGATPHSFIDRHRFMRACELLENSRMRLDNIAALCGFPDLKYFIGWFKRKSGQSPGRWRGGY